MSNREFLIWISDLFSPYVHDPGIRNYISCQFALESDFGSSPLAQGFNNFCGMKCAKMRLTSRDRFISRGGFAVYDSVDLCVVDYILWCQYAGMSQRTFESLSSFRSLLKRGGYCLDSDYIDKIDNLYNQYFN